jgi:alcohol dehydrogenase class IV
VLPRAIVYDASLMLSLPVPLSVASGLNALAHCVDSMWAPRTDPVDQALALEGIRALRDGLPSVVRDPQGIEGRAAQAAEAITGMHKLVSEAISQGHAVADPAALAAQIHSYRSAALLGASQTPARAS